LDLYLVRHPEPKLEKGVCYGQTDLMLVEGAIEKVLVQIKDKLPHSLPIYSSPLKRCSALAEKLGPYETDRRLMELNFGDWELQKWDDISPMELESWMMDYMNQRPPNGENGNDLHARVGDFLEELENKPTIIVGHLGVFRSIYAHVNKIPLQQAFEKFNMSYGEVQKLTY